MNLAPFISALDSGDWLVFALLGAFAVWFIASKWTHIKVQVEGIPSIKADINAIQQDISKIDGRVSKIDGRVSKIEGHVSKIDGRISRIDEHLDDLIENVNALNSGRKVRKAKKPA